MTERGAVGPDRLMRIATAHLARHAASTARLRQVLARRIRRLAGDAEDSPDGAALDALIDPVIDRLRRAGLIDDAAFARGRARTLAAKGQPAWRIKADLSQDFGIDADEAGLTDTLADLDPAVQATRWAERRRLGPFRTRDRAARRDRDVASLARAGFAVAVAQRVIDGDGWNEGPASP